MTASFQDNSTNTFTAVPLVTPVTADEVSEPSATAIDRIDRTLHQLEELAELLSSEDDYAMPALPFGLPADFKLSVVIPVYNEEATLYQILGRVCSLPVPLEIILVDDCSTDGTRELLKPLERVEDLRIFYKHKNEGKGAALRTGFQHAAGDVVIVQDADLEYDPRDILDVIKPIVEGQADVVYGSRFLGDEQQDPSFLHRLGNGMLTRASNLFTRQRLTDMETCYKAFRRGLLKRIEIKQARFGFEPEITAKLSRRGVKIQEVPIRYNARSYDEGKKIGVKDAVNAFYCIVRYGLRD